MSSCGRDTVTRNCPHLGKCETRLELCSGPHVTSVRFTWLLITNQLTVAGHTVPSSKLGEFLEFWVFFHAAAGAVLSSASARSCWKWALNRYLMSLDQMMGWSPALAQPSITSHSSLGLLSGAKITIDNGKTRPRWTGGYFIYRISQYLCIRQLGWAGVVTN